MCEMNLSCGVIRLRKSKETINVFKSNDGMRPSAENDMVIILSCFVFRKNPALLCSEKGTFESNVGFNV